VVDIGAGTGAFTRALVGAGAQVVALELDRALAAQLRNRFGQEVTVVEADARRWRWPRTPFSVVSNLPFAGSGEILSALLDPLGFVQRADVVVQWELAVKYGAVVPSTLRGTYWRAWFDVAVVGHLARNAFAPSPSVDAAVLRFSRRATPLVPPDEHASYRRLLAAAFDSRSPLYSGLRPRLSTREVRRLSSLLGFDPAARARDLDARQWAGIHNFARTRPGPRK
jgi:23S rRNA (adenine-N6)-dimethyltransferase